MERWISLSSHRLQPAFVTLTCLLSQQPSSRPRSSGANGTLLGMPRFSKSAAAERRPEPLVPDGSTAPQRTRAPVETNRSREGLVRKLRANSCCQARRNPHQTRGAWSRCRATPPRSTRTTLRSAFSASRYTWPISRGGGIRADYVGTLARSTRGQAGSISDCDIGI